MPSSCMPGRGLTSIIGDASIIASRDGLTLTGGEGDGSDDFISSGTEN